MQIKKLSRVVIKEELVQLTGDFNILCGILPSSLGGRWITSFLFRFNT